MTLGHFIYIPGILLLGIIIGYVLGGRAAQTVAQDREDRDKRRAAREARRNAQAD